MTTVDSDISDWEQEKCVVEATGENENATVCSVQRADALVQPASPLMARCQRTNRWEAANRLTPSKVSLQEIQFHFISVYLI